MSLAVRQLFEYHPVIGFRFVPKLKVRVPHEGGGYLVRTNETGFRSDRPFTAAKPHGAKRVLLFGDSFTAGDGVSNGKRYGDWCERAVHELEVFNFGLPATGLDQHHLVYREYASGIEHDLMVIAIFVENIRRVGSRYRHFVDDAGRLVLYAKPYYTLEGGELSLHGVPPPRQPLDDAAIPAAEQAYVFTRERFPGLKAVYNRLRRHPAFERWAIESGAKDRLLRLLRYQVVKEYDDERHPAWRVMRALLQHWIRGHARPVVVMPIPLRHYVDGISDPAAYLARLRGAAQEAGARFFDPLPALSGLPAAERKGLYFPGDGHLTRAGHEALGRALARFLAAQPELRSP